jgi:penicillin amidase
MLLMSPHRALAWALGGTLACAACETGGGAPGAVRDRVLTPAPSGSSSPAEPVEPGESAEPVGPPPPPGEALIIIDRSGVPHIYASTDEDLFYAYGYQLASDRMLQLEMWRRFAHGRRAEVLGQNAKGSFGATTLQDDLLVRTFDLPHFGRLDAELMRREDPEHWRLLQAWRAGLNRRVEEIRGGAAPLPFGFGPDALDFLPEPWAEDDPVIVQKMIHLGLDQTILYEILTTILGQLAPQALDALAPVLFVPGRETWQIPPEDQQFGGLSLPRDTRLARAGLPTGRVCPDLPFGSAALRDLIGAPRAGSNSWAVDGRFTADGRPMLAGDPHLQFTLMGNMYAVHLDSLDGGGTFDVAGFAFTAAPGLFAGHNRDIAWTPTSAFGDVMDLWEVPVSDDGQTALIGGEPVPIETRTEVVPLREGGAREMRFARVPGHGVLFDPLVVGVPLPLAAPGKRVMIGWTGFKGRSSRYFLGLNRARDVDDFDRAVMAIPEMSYNWVAIDRRALTYRVGLEVPRRNTPAPGREPWRLMDGSDPSALWLPGALGPDELPHGRAGTRGFVVTANNDPHGLTADGDLSDAPFYYGAYFDPGYRAHRITVELERLTARGGLTVEDMRVLQNDVHSGMADDLVVLLEAAWQAVTAGLDPALSAYADRGDLATLVELITVTWDRRMARDSAGAVAFHALMHFAAARLLEDDITGIIYERVAGVAPFFVMKVALQTLAGLEPATEPLLDGEGPHGLLLGALEETATWLTARFGGVEPSRYRFDAVRFSDFDNAFGLGMPVLQVPTDGGEDTVNVAHARFREDGRPLYDWPSDYGPVERMIAHFPTADGPPRIHFNFPLGNVAEPDGPHFDDLLPDWTEGRVREMPYSAAEVAAAAERRVRLVRR